MKPRSVMPVFLWGFMWLLAGIPGLLAQEGPRVAKWQPWDFEFKAQTGSSNPFQVPITATIEGPGGIKFTSLGFYDGNGIWKVRVSPSAEGLWSLATHSPQADLDGRKMTFTCLPNTNSNIRGGARIDPGNPRHFIREDGSRWFALGYECDWLWALDLDRPNTLTLDRFLDKLAADGFSFIVTSAYGHDTPWLKGNSGPDDFGPPPLYPWEGTNEQPDHSRFNLAYWRHFDRLMEALHQRGIDVQLMTKVWNKFVNWPANNSPEDDQYYRWLVARYAAYPNVHWSLGKESQREKNLAYKLSRFKLIRDSDPHRRLLTTHDDAVVYDSGHYYDVLDYRSDQHKMNLRDNVLALRGRWTWPLVMVEYGYEHGPKGKDDKTYGVAQTPTEVCRRAWEVQMAGGYGVYYYTYTGWDVIRTEDTPPGYAHMKHLREFFEKTTYWRLQPDTKVVGERSGYCLSDPGREYVVYQDSTNPFTVVLERISSPLRATWYRPLTGEWLDGEPLGSGRHLVKPPAQWSAGPVVLHLAGNAPSGARR